MLEARKRREHQDLEKFKRSVAMTQKWERYRLLKEQMETRLDIVRRRSLVLNHLVRCMLKHLVYKHFKEKHEESKLYRIKVMKQLFLAELVKYRMGAFLRRIHPDVNGRVARYLRTNIIAFNGCIEPIVESRASEMLVSFMEDTSTITKLSACMIEFNRGLCRL